MKIVAEWTVYMIQAHNGNIYTGITNDLKRRFDEHQHQKNKGARFFRLSGPEKIIFCEKWANRSEASKREITIKKMSRQQKLILANEYNESIVDQKGIN